MRPDEARRQILAYLQKHFGTLDVGLTWDEKHSKLAVRLIVRDIRNPLVVRPGTLRLVAEAIECAPELAAARRALEQPLSDEELRARLRARRGQ